jgi:hypothetical protein
LRPLLLTIAIVLLIFAGTGIGLVEGGKIPATVMPFIIAAYILSLGIWVWLTIKAQSWGGRLGGYIVIAVGCVILYFFLKANF